MTIPSPDFVSYDQASTVERIMKNLRQEITQLRKSLEESRYNRMYGTFHICFLHSFPCYMLSLPGGIGTLEDYSLFVNLSKDSSHAKGVCLCYPVDGDQISCIEFPFSSGFIDVFTQHCKETSF